MKGETVSCLFAIECVIARLEGIDEYLKPAGLDGDWFLEPLYECLILAKIRRIRARAVKERNAKLNKSPAVAASSATIAAKDESEVSE